MGSSLMTVLIAIGGWGHGATTPVTPREVVVSTVAALAGTLLCVFYARERALAQRSTATLGLLGLLLAAPDAQA